MTGRANVTQIRQELISTYGFSYDDANFILKHTAEDKRRPSKEWRVPNADGFITLRYHNLSRFTLEDHRRFPPESIDARNRPEYNRGRKGIPMERKATERRATDMPPARGRRAAPAPPPPPAPEPEENGQVDFQKYLDKDPTPTMVDYVTWFEENVADLNDVEPDRLLVLGASMYGHFQRSDFNQERREERRTARAASRPAPEPEPEPEPPAKPARGRPRRTAAAAAPPPPAPAPAPARRRGRPAKASAEAPY